MGRLFFGVLLAVALVFGATQASALLFWIMGPWTAVGIEHDGSATQMAFGQNLPRPAWVPVYPGATIVQSSFLTSAQMPSGFGTLQLGTDQVDVMIRTPDGLLPSRLVEIHWRKISESPPVPPERP
jgi:hypothetical protein